MSLYRRTLATVLLLFCASSSVWGNGLFSSWGEETEPELLEAVEVFKLEDVRQQDDRFQINGNVADGSAVAERLALMQIVRPDVTHNDATDRALLQHWGVMGPPTLILVGPNGTERRDLRMVGDVNKSEFLARLDEAGAP